MKIEKFTAKNGKTYVPSDRNPWEANGRMVAQVRLVRDGAATCYTRNMPVAEIEEAQS